MKPIVASCGVLSAVGLLCVWGLLRATVRIRHTNRPADFLRVMGVRRLALPGACPRGIASSCRDTMRPTIKRHLDANPA